MRAFISRLLDVVFRRQCEDRLPEEIHANLDASRPCATSNPNLNCDYPNR